MLPLASLYVLFLIAVPLPFIAVRLWRGKSWAADALGATTGWPREPDGALAVRVGDATGSARVLGVAGHTYLEVRLAFPTPEAARSALGRMPHVARKIPVVHTGQPDDRTIVVRLAWETLVVPADLVRRAIVELAVTGVAGDASVPPIDPIFAAVTRRPRWGGAALQASALVLVAGLSSSFFWWGGFPETAVTAILLLGVFQMGQIVRRLLGLALSGKLVPLSWRAFGYLVAVLGLAGLNLERPAPAHLLGGLALLGVFLELARALRAARVAYRLSRAGSGGWRRVTGTVRDPDGQTGPRPFLLVSPEGEYWVEAGPTHTLFAGSPELRDGVALEVIGRASDLPADGAYRRSGRRLIGGEGDVPLTVAAVGARPARWIAVEAALAALVAAGYAAGLAQFYGVVG